MCVPSAARPKKLFDLALCSSGSARAGVQLWPPSRLRLEKLRLIRGEVNSINIDIIINEAQNVGSAELMIKALLLKAFIQLGGALDQQLQATLNAIYEIKEIKDYPQQLLELAKIETI